MSSIEFATTIIFSLVGLLTLTFISKSIEFKRKNKQNEAETLGSNLEFLDETLSVLPVHLLDNALSSFLMQMRENHLNQLSQTGADTASVTRLVGAPKQLPQDPRKLLEISRQLKSLSAYLTRCEVTGVLPRSGHSAHQQSLVRSISKIKIQLYWLQAEKALKEKNPEYALHSYAMCLQQFSHHKRTVADQQMMDKIQQQINAIKNDATPSETETSEPVVANAKQETPEITSAANDSSAKDSQQTDHNWENGWKKKVVYD
ncbi:MAG: hypothetical protein KUG72_00775 [Pseudomonadales bacterium]|nr:hypothetical protein [Pseudomonadales bacterium]